MSDLISSGTLLVLAGAVAGALNALAGGGTFFTFPALLAVGLPPIAANATGTTALLPGYIASVFALRTQVQPLASSSSMKMLAITLSGGAFGALLLMTTSNAAFRFIVPWFVLFATIVFALAPYLGRQDGDGLSTSRLALPSLFCIASYGGYFNGGLGVLLLAHSMAFGEQSMQRAQARKNVLSVMLTGIAVIVYSASGQVHWHQAAWVTVGAIFGGHVGSVAVVRLGMRVLRFFVITAGVLLSAALFAQTSGHL